MKEQLERAANWVKMNPARTAGLVVAATIVTVGVIAVVKARQAEGLEVLFEAVEGGTEVLVS